MTQFDPTRQAALARLADFVPLAGRSYAHGRNTDQGRGRHTAVSCLSPYTRRRLLTEQEIVEAVLAQHDPREAEKFIAEVFWRTYFKGWLERRPSVWDHYTRTRDAMIPDFEGKPFLERAESGNTDIAIFNDWAQELIETGYLHNHARMWFASIWIFTLRLPWQLGADFFLRHLIDGDPASNTLSWRWVAGLHTRGKHYLAQRTNIERFTRNRPPVEPGKLDETAEALEESFDYGPALPVRAPLPVASERPSALLLTIEDCHPESLSLPDTLATGFLSVDGRSPRPTAQNVSDFDDAALADTRARVAGDAPMLRDVHGLIDWAKATGATQIITPFTPRGPVHDWLTKAQPALAAHGLSLAEVQRPWDALVWPLASAGFFKIKKAIPKTLDRLEIGT